MTLGILVMAAGESRRFGGCKLLAEVKGTPILAHAVAKARKLSPGYLAVISGGRHAQLQQALQSDLLPEMPLIYNPNWRGGLGHSIAFGVSQLPPHIDRVMILLADQITVTEQHLRELLSAAEGCGVASAVYQGRRGAPAVFDQCYFEQLMQLTGDRGASELLNNQLADVGGVAIPEAVFDIDTPQDLARFSKRLC